MEVVKRREEVGAVALLVAVIEWQQIRHGLLILCVFSTKKVVLQKAGLGYKKVKFVLEADEVSVYNQLT